jgi:MFS family permease
LSLVKSRSTHRIAVGALFFIQGIGFSSWASRIPTIQDKLNLSETQLGLVLFIIPVGLMFSLPCSGWLVSRYGSRQVVNASIVCYFTTLVFIGLSSSILQLLMALFAFGLFGNMVNISLNTQAVNVEALYSKTIMSSFHGLWSIAGFAGAAIGTLMIGQQVEPVYHFLIAAALSLLILAIFSKGTIHSDSGTKSGGKFVWPDRPLVLLGLISFFSLVCEGAMFDWSGVYFKKVVLAKESWMGAGYAIFMCSMAAGRFIADKLVARLGLKRMLQINGVMTATGLLISVLFPTLVTAMIGFSMVGFGISSVVPLVYSAAGKSKILSPGTAIATVSSIGFIGFLVGPPVIGLIAGAFDLRISFFVIAMMGLCVTLIARFVREE